MSLREVLEMDLEDLAHWIPVATGFQQALNEAQKQAASR